MNIFYETKGTRLLDVCFTDEAADNMTVLTSHPNTGLTRPLRDSYPGFSVCNLSRERMLGREGQEGQRNNT